MIRRCPYSFRFFKFFDYSLLRDIRYIKRSGRSKTSDTYNDVIIMIDTETSKETPKTVCKNYVVAWTLSMRAYGQNLVTLYGTRPSELVTCINNIIMNMRGDNTIIFVHNLSYDWVFLRKFFMQAWGTPEHQLNTKPHYPIFITFANGVMLRDSLILAQRSLDKWAKDLNVEHQKAVGAWVYDEIRQQGNRFTPDEKTYIEHDTLAGVECIDKTMHVLNKKIYSLPYTATGIPREEVRKRAKSNRGLDLFKKCVCDYDTQKFMEDVFHGGYTHNNRHYCERVVRGNVDAYDEASAYPYVMCAYKFPMSKFYDTDPASPEWILNNAIKYAYIFTLILIKPRLKNDRISMPALQKSKGIKMINAVDDNGRILCAEYFEIRLNEIDLGVIMQQYDYDKAICIDVKYAIKDYLPRWFTDYVYQCFVDKTQLKGGDPVQYSIAKAKLNSLYGMCVQRPVKLIIEENYQTGDYSIDSKNIRFKTGKDKLKPVGFIKKRHTGYKRRRFNAETELYKKYVNSYNSVLPYQWGVWVTSLAFANLFEIGSYAGTWIYSDTDSCYGVEWDKEGIAAYNERCKLWLCERGYGAVEHNGREYWLGVCELDGQYKEFVSVGAKRYAVRKREVKFKIKNRFIKTAECRKHNKKLHPLRDLRSTLKITVAGVPKSGVLCLNNDIRKFKKDLIFDGETTGKMQHTYFYEDDIYIDQNGNERGDSIDLSPTTYILDSVSSPDWEKIWEEEISIQVYDERSIK